MRSCESIASGAEARRRCSSGSRAWRMTTSAPGWLVSSEAGTTHNNRDASAPRPLPDASGARSLLGHSHGAT
eukprot:6195037-Pleurochrysis_carterae.AAC.8